MHTCRLEIFVHVVCVSTNCHVQYPQCPVLTEKHLVSILSLQFSTMYYYLQHGILVAVSHLSQTTPSSSRIYQLGHSKLQTSMLSVSLHPPYLCLKNKVCNIPTPTMKSYPSPSTHSTQPYSHLCLWSGHHSEGDIRVWRPLVGVAAGRTFELSIQVSPSSPPLLHLTCPPGRVMHHFVLLCMTCGSILSWAWALLPIVLQMHRYKLVCGTYCLQSQLFDAVAVFFLGTQAALAKDRFPEHRTHNYMNG